MLFRSSADNHSIKKAIRLKINNFIPIRKVVQLQSMDVCGLSEMGRELVRRRPAWKGRIIIIAGKNGVSEQSGIIRL